LAAARGALGQLDGRPVVVVLARRKDQQVLLRALLVLRRPVAVALVGIEPDRELAALRDALPGRHRAVFVPFTEHPLAFYRLAAAAALPSRIEGLSQALLEAMALGLPVLASEASQIAECVRGLTWADEVLVADGGSIDGTAERARTAGARVLSGDWATIAAQRNAAIAVARHEWVLAVDADERVGPELAREIAAVVAAPAHEAYAARRRNGYLGRTITHAGWGSDWVVRVFRRTSRFVERRVHEALERQRDVGRLRAPLEHVPYRDLAHHLAQLGACAERAALALAPPA